MGFSVNIRFVISFIWWTSKPTKTSWIRSYKLNIIWFFLYHVQIFQAQLHFYGIQLRSWNKFNFAILSNDVTRDYSSFATIYVNWIIISVSYFKNLRAKKEAYITSRFLLISELTMCQRSSRWSSELQGNDTLKQFIRIFFTRLL